MVFSNKPTKPAKPGKQTKQAKAAARAPSPGKKLRPADVDGEPCPEFGGLSPRQLLDLLKNGWWSKSGPRMGAPGSACRRESFGNRTTAKAPRESFEAPARLRSDLSIAELRRVPIICNARMFLATLAEAGPTHAATDGNLPRSIVEKVLGSYVTSEVALLEDCQHRRNLEERDFPGLFQLRYLCQFAGLLACRKSYWSVTSAGRAQLQEERSGELFALLFNTLFRKFTLSNMDQLPALAQFQDSIPYVLFRLLEVPEGKRFAMSLVPDLVLLPVVVGLLEKADSSQDLAISMVYLRALRPLEDFGLLKMYSPKSDDPNAWPTHVSRTPLFDRFLKFQIQQVGS